MLRSAGLLVREAAVTWKHAVAQRCPRGSCSTCWPGEPSGPLVDALRFVARHADWLMHRPEAEQAYDELTAVVEGARRTIDTRGGQQYAGPCDVCERDMYAATGAAVVECKPCGVSHDMADRREWLLSAAEDRLATAAELARAVSGLGQPVTAATIRQWASRGRLAAHGMDGTRPRYRVGDVTQLVRESAQRRADAG